MLVVENLHVAYGAIKALHGIHLEVPEGSIVTLIGANGAGKSTALRALSGLVKSTSGSIRYDGQEISKLAPEKIVASGLCHVPEVAGHADADGDVTCGVGGQEDLVSFDGSPNRFGPHGCMPQVGSGEKNGELLPTESTRKVDGAGVVVKNLSEGLQHHVPARMPVGVVDVLEVIDVDHQDACRRAIGLARLHQFGGPYIEATALAESFSSVSRESRSSAAAADSNGRCSTGISARSIFTLGWVPSQ